MTKQTPAMQSLSEPHVEESVKISFSSEGSMISKAGTNNTCATCEHMTAERWCRSYTNDITGEHADLTEARASCRGSHWTKRPTSTDHIVFTTHTKQDQDPDKIETPMATIYRDPPAKLYE